MKKDICDLCHGDLIEFKSVSQLMGGFYTDRYELKKKYLFPSMLWSPFTGSGGEKKVDICEKCMDDFKEFIQRKKACLTKV